METFKQFMSKFTRLVPYRLSARLFETCAENAGDFGPLNGDLVYSSNSMKELLARESERVRYMSEAELKTFPAAKLVAAVCKAFARQTGLPAAVDDEMRGLYRVMPDGRVDAADPEQGDLKCAVRYFELPSGFSVESGISGNVVFYFSCSAGAAEIVKKKCLAKMVQAGHWCGYNYVYCVYEERSRNFMVGFEPMHGESGFETGGALYHVAPSNLEGRILRQGIVPKSKSAILGGPNGWSGTKFEHPDRVYFFTKFDMDMFERFAEQVRGKSSVYDAVRKTCGPVREFTVFEIDRSKMKNYNLYRDGMFDNDDPDSPVAVYTYSNVPPSAVKKIKSFKV